MSPKNRFYWLLVTGYWLLSYSIVSAEEVKIKEPIVVNGDGVEYFHEKKQVVGSGNISITYKDVLLTCDKITVYLDTRQGIAEGNVKITQEGAYFTGDKMNYNFDTRVGRVINGYVNSKPFYGKAREIDKVSDKQVNLKTGYVTTCDLEQPHYRVQAKQIRIYLDDKVIAKHVLFFVKNTPVFYWPYYIQPIKERSAHATVQVGRTRDWGYYALTSFRYYFSEIAKGRFLVDYRTKKGLAEGIDNYYSLKGLGSGSARFYYINENDSTAFSPSGEVESKWRAQVRHKWEMRDDTIVTFEFNKLRDKNFIKDYLYKEYEELGEPDNYLSIVTTKDYYSTTFLLRKR
ncbi:MAG: LPS-assembly protein LptD, partial [Candidatus Omnitrophica bacterium]|nr:LPS-assembly protein LptD [Candidatus Omnitrophota bacterium]